MGERESRASPAQTAVSEDLYALQVEPIELATLVAHVAGPGFGAVATFSGTVRDSFQGRRVLHLEYEAYDPLALKVLREIGAGVRARLGVGRIAIVHRTGRLEIGETSVAIAVSAPHRRVALEACGEAIERLKAELPVWKKEFFEDGAVWRENDPRSGVSPGRALSSEPPEGRAR
jgi:molybdopterin synthase catalytic subunit